MGGRRPHFKAAAGEDFSDDCIQQRLVMRRQRLWSGDAAMRKTIPETMFAGREPARLSVLQKWVIENAVTEIEMNEQQFWNFVSLQPVAEKPWTTYMGRLLHVSDMPTDSQKCLVLFDKRTPGAI